MNGQLLRARRVERHHDLVTPNRARGGAGNAISTGCMVALVVLLVLIATTYLVACSWIITGW